MTRDYKNSAPGAGSGTKRGQGTPCWVWFGAGLICGAFGAGLAWLKLPHLQVPGVSAPPPAESAKQAAAPNTKNNKEPDSTPSTAPRPTFQFYNLLPEDEVVVSDEEMKKPERKPASTTVASEKVSPQTPERSKSGAYVLQMGAFKQSADAERLRARLALLGIEAEVQKVSVDNRTSFHRVRSRPIASRDDVSRIRTQLDRNQIDSMVIKMQP